VRQLQKPPASTNPPQFIGRTKLGRQEVPLPKLSAVLPTPNTTGGFEEMCLVAGESAGLVKDIRPAREIVHEMMAEARKIITERLVRIADHLATAVRRG